MAYHLARAARVPERGATSVNVGSMVAREAELVALLDHLTAVGTGAQSVEIVGEAGIGKTLLLDTFATVARDQGAAVLSGRASEFEQDVPFAAARDALAGLPHGLDDDGEPSMRHIKHRAIRTLLEQQAASTPTILIVDDLHWADGATIDLIASLIDRPPAAPVLLLLGHRPFQAGSLVASTMGSAAARGHLHRIALAPFDLPATSTLLGPDVPRDEAVRLHEACGGNPFLLRQLGRVGAGAAGGGTPTDAVASLLGTELAPLSPAAREFLDAAAVAGDPFELDLAASIAGVRATDPSSVAALDELSAADLIRSTPEPRKFAFRHPLIRRHVYDALGTGWRLAAHGRAADALRARGAAATALAHHVEQSAAPGDEAAIAVLAAAGKQVAGRAPASAARWLSAAWAIVPASRQLDSDATEILYGLGQALTLSGHGEEALGLRAETIEALPLSDPIRMRFELGRVMIEETLARFSSAGQRLRDLEASFGETPSVEALIVAMGAATLEAGIGNLPEARVQLDRGARIVAALGWPGLEAFVQPVAGWVHYASGDLRAAAAACEVASTNLAALDDAILARYPSPLASLARTAWSLGMLESARAHAARGLVVTNNGEWPILATQLLAIRSNVDLVSGRLREALDGADAACEEAQLIRNAEATFWAHGARSGALEPTSAIERALSEAELCLEAARRQGMPGPLGMAGQVLGRALLAAGLPARAIETIHDTHGGDGLPRLTVASRGESFAILTAAHLARGDRDAAARAARQAQALADEVALPLPAAYAAASDAFVQLEAGRADAAIAAATAATDHSRAAGASLLAARAQLIVGRAQVEAGDREAATTTLRAAERDLLAFGADRLQAEAVRLLRRMGRRVTRSGRGAQVVPSEALTKRQQEIAELAAGGRSNREIAEVLFLSQKTVESHLAAVFVKLGVDSRRELTELLTSDRAVPGPDAD